MSGGYGNDNLIFGGGGQFIAYSNSSEQSAALPVNTVAVRLKATTNCWVVIGSNPTAAVPSAEKTRSATVLPLIANLAEDFMIPRGTEAAPMKVAVIRDSIDGTLFITDLSFV